jgi:tetratricopeptide (TPR) repeat protein
MREQKGGNGFSAKYVLYTGIAGTIIGSLVFSIPDLLEWISSIIWLYITAKLVFLAVGLTGLGIVIVWILRRIKQLIITLSRLRTLFISIPEYKKTVRLFLEPQLRTTIEQNRSNYIEEIKNYLDAGKRCLIITGAKGVGKSTLAAYFAKGDDFWYDFVGKTINLSTLLILCAQWLGDNDFENLLKQKMKVGKEEIEFLCERMQGLGKRLFFDNLETLLKKKKRRFVNAGVSLFFERLLETAHDCQVIITSRLMPVFINGTELDHLQVVARVRVEGLDDDRGAEILQSGGADRTEFDKLKEISRQVGGNPLILRQLLPIVNRASASGVIKDLKAWKAKYKGEILKAILFEEATKEGLELIFRMSVVPDRIGLENVERLCDGSEKAGDLVDDLVRRSLLEWDREKSLFWLHPVVAETVQDELLKSPEKLKAARHSALRMYWAEARSGKQPDQWKSLDDCFALVRAAEQLIALGDFTAASGLVVDFLTKPLDRWGHWMLLRWLHENLLVLWEAMREKPKELLVNYRCVLGNYGIMLLSLGDYTKAIGFLEIILKITLEMGDRLAEGNTLGNLGAAYFALGNYHKAIEFNKKRLKIALEIGDRLGESQAYGNLGSTYSALGDYTKAIKFQEIRLKIAVEIGDRRIEGKSYGNLGNAYDAIGECPKAIEYYKKQIFIAEQISDALGLASGNYNLGNTYKKMENWPKAAFHYVRGLITSVRIRAPQSQMVFQTTKESKANLGDESFRRIATESLGPEDAEVVEKILVDFEKALEAAKKAAKKDKSPDGTPPDKDQKKDATPDPRLL